jgi:predicted nucleotidyltransferase
MNENEKYFKNYQNYLNTIENFFMKDSKCVSVYLFGYFAEGRHAPSSDIDVLIVPKKMYNKVSERKNIEVEVWNNTDFFLSFDFNLLNEGESEWYKNFFKKLVAV